MDKYTVDIVKFRERSEVFTWVGEIQGLSLEDAQGLVQLITLSGDNPYSATIQPEETDYLPA